MSYRLRWVKAKKYAEESGEAPSAVHARLRRGVWLDGVHAKIVDGNLWVNLEKVDEWREDWPNQACASARTRVGGG